jgi:hypothetical protein
MRTMLRAATVLAIVTLLASVAIAVSIHFISATASVSSTTGDLTVAFKEAGLGNNVTINYALSATVGTAGYDCINGGGKHPSANNKETVTQPLGPVTGSFTSGKNGNITAALTLEPPPPSTDFSCPTGQSLVLGCVSYSGISFEDTSNSITPDLTGYAGGPVILLNVKNGATCQ